MAAIWARVRWCCSSGSGGSETGAGAQPNCIERGQGADRCQCIRAIAGRPRADSGHMERRFPGKGRVVREGGRVSGETDRYSTIGIPVSGPADPYQPQVASAPTNDKEFAKARKRTASLGQALVRKTAPLASPMLVPTPNSSEIRAPLHTRSTFHPRSLQARAASSGH